MTDQQLNEYIDKLYDLYKKSDKIVNNDLVAFTARERELIRLAHTDTVLLKMQEFDLVKGVNIGTVEQTWSLTQLGRKVLRFGSWTKYQRHLHDKEINDAKNSEYLTRTRWWPLIFSAIGLIVSIISLARTCNSTEQSETQADKQSKGHEVEEYVPRTNPTDSSSNLKVDSASYKK